MSARESVDRKQFLSFTLAGGDYGIEILQVKEILQCEKITRVPSVPESIRGVINLRGAVVPVLDVALKFGLPETQLGKLTCILIVEAALEGERTVMGILVDAVREVLELGTEDIDPPPAFGTRVRVDCLTGMGKLGKGFVLLLDLDRIVSAGERELAATCEGDAAMRAALASSQNATSAVAKEGAL